MRLNFVDSLFFPFRAKSFALFGLANRAISLIAVFSIVFMAILAVRFLRVNVPYRSRVFARVLARCKRFDVLWIDACPISADMVCDHAVWNWSSTKEHGDSSRPSRRSSKGYGAVTIAILRSLPFMAVSYLDPFRIEARDFFLCWRSHSNITYMVSLDHKVITDTYRGSMV